MHNYSSVTEDLPINILHLKRNHYFLSLHTAVTCIF